MGTRNFLTLLDLSADELGGLIKRAVELKAQAKTGTFEETCKHRVLAMVFEKIIDAHAHVLRSRHGTAWRACSFSVTPRHPAWSRRND